MKSINYHQKYGLYGPIIQETPSENLYLIVVVPCYDEPDWKQSLEALMACDLPEVDIEIIVVVNHSIDEQILIKKRNLETYQKGKQWAKEQNNDRLRFFFLSQFEMPPKWAGVGLARKIGMDEAVHRFNKINNKNGIVLCFDADSGCDPDYLTSVYEHFQSHPKTPACSIYYEHPLAGDAFSDEVYEAIITYELHLRYYIQAKRWAGFPFAYHTVGSSMAVRSIAYQRQGGMNKRQAGEDFYFLHKFTSHPHFSELTTTRVIPSPRPSHRVPFGTGKAIAEQLKGEERKTYDPRLFLMLYSFFQQLKQVYEKGIWELQVPDAVLRQFLEENDAQIRIEEIRTHTSSWKPFEKRFFNWFNAFQIMKFLHFARTRGFPDVPVQEAAVELYKRIKPEIAQEEWSRKGLLLKYRELDRKGWRG